MTADGFLSAIPLFAAFTRAQLAAVESRVVERRYAPGDRILRAGDQNDALYLLRSGQLAVEVRRGQELEAVATLHPGAPFGELSLITGRPCSADIRVVTESAVAILPGDALAALPAERRLIFDRLLTLVAERLHSTLTEQSPAHPQPLVVLLRAYDHWLAPAAFGAELAASLAWQTASRTLRVTIRAGGAAEAMADGRGAWVVQLDPSAGWDAINREVARRVPEWRRQFGYLVLDASGAPDGVVREWASACDWQGHLLGPGDRVPAIDRDREFLVQDATAATLEKLSGCEQLIAGVAAAEDAFCRGGPAGISFRRTVDSVARGIARMQVGLALGGGGAWSFAHIGVLRALQRARVPVDVVSGCSMGSVIAALLATGRDPAYMEAAVAEWRRRFLRIIEYRVWRMHLASVPAVTRLLREQFGERRINSTDVPYWANALDIETSEEVPLTDGELVTGLLAAMALPAWLPPASRDSRLLVDAVFVNPVPSSLVRRMHSRFAIAVNAIGPPRARALPARFPFRAFDFVGRCLRIVAHEVGRVRAETAADIVMMPDVGDASMLSIDRSTELIEAGEREAEAHMPAILAGYGRLRRAAQAAE